MYDPTAYYEQEREPESHWAWRVAWLLLGFVFLLFLGFTFGVEHEKRKWTEAIGGCELPINSLEAVEIFQINGRLACARRNR